MISFQLYTSNEKLCCDELEELQSNYSIHRHHSNLLLPTRISTISHKLGVTQLLILCIGITRETTTGGRGVYKSLLLLSE